MAKPKVKTVRKKAPFDPLAEKLEVQIDIAYAVSSLIKALQNAQVAHLLLYLPDAVEDTDTLDTAVDQAADSLYTAGDTLKKVKSAWIALKRRAKKA